MKKWVVLTAGVVSQTALGGIYAWSTFVPHLMGTYGLSRVQCGLIFGVMIAVFTLATFPASRVLLKYGPRLTAGTGAILFGGGYILASFSGGNYILLITGIGILTGAGIGFGYICPLTVGMSWFPENKGIVTGVTVAGFGFGAILLSWIASMLLVSMDVLVMFRIIGVGFGGTAFAAAMFLAEPLPSGPSSGSDRKKNSLHSYRLNIEFLLIWFGMFSGTFAGLLVSGNLKPMKLSLGLSEYQAALSISLFAVGNTLGRLVWGRIHDRLGSRKTILLSLGTLFFSLLPPVFLTDPAALLPATVLIGFGFGSCFVVYAASVANMFGIQALPVLYPLCFTGYGLAALLGPAAGGWIADAFSSYSGALMLSAGVLMAAFVTLYMWFPSCTGNLYADPEYSRDRLFRQGTHLRWYTRCALRGGSKR